MEGLGLVELLLGPVLVAMVVWALVKIYKRRTYKEPGMRYLEHGHLWHRTDFVRRPTYCSSCEELSLSGRYCSSCDLRVCSSEECLRTVNARLKCKYLQSLLVPGSGEGDGSTAVQYGGPAHHHWVKGNLSLESMCALCGEACGDEPRLADWQCAWCFRTVHEACLGPLESGAHDALCDLGPHRSVLFPPNCLRLKVKGRGRSQQLFIDTMAPPTNIPSWSPLLVMVNPKSGGQEGERVLAQLTRLLNPVQVVNMAETTPEAALHLCTLLPDLQWKVLVCGGDGTVGWVLAALDWTNLTCPPAVGVLPLGTGNDLGRVLGWGGGYEGGPLSDILSDVEHTQLTMMDRWSVCVQPSGRFGVRLSPVNFMMNNYLGVGCDAGVALNFHKRRESNPGLFISRIFNKAWYFGYGAKDVLEQSCKALQSKIEVWLDGRHVELPALEGVVVLNINSWSAGCSMWREGGKDGLAASRMDDGLVEVVGLYSSLHVGRIQVNVDEPIRIGQAKEVKIVVRETVPVQIDGEPWQQKPSVITISCRGQCKMLKRVNELGGDGEQSGSTSNLLKLVLESEGKQPSTVTQ